MAEEGRLLVSGDSSDRLDLVFVADGYTAEVFDSRFTLLADWEMAVPDNPEELGDLPRWMEEREWISPVS